MKLDDYLKKSCGISSYLCIATDNKDKKHETYETVIKHLFANSKVLRTNLRKLESDSSQSKNNEQEKPADTAPEKKVEFVAFKITKEFINHN